MNTLTTLEAQCTPVFNTGMPSYLLDRELHRSVIVNHLRSREKRLTLFLQRFGRHVHTVESGECQPAPILACSYGQITVHERGAAEWSDEALWPDEP